MPSTNGNAQRVFAFLKQYPDEIHLNAHIARALSLTTDQVSSAVGTIIRWSGSSVSRPGIGSVRYSTVKQDVPEHTRREEVNKKQTEVKEVTTPMSAYKHIGNDLNGNPLVLAPDGSVVRFKFETVV
jgi:hypothetical protein